MQLTFQNKQFLRELNSNLEADLAVLKDYRESLSTSSQISAYDRISSSIKHYIEVFIHENKEHPLFREHATSLSQFQISQIFISHDNIDTTLAYLSSIIYHLELVLHPSYKSLLRLEKKVVKSVYSTYIKEGKIQHYDLSREYEMIMDCLIRLEVSRELAILFPDFHKRLIKSITLIDESYFSFYSTPFDVSINLGRFVQYYSRYRKRVLLRFSQLLLRSPLYKATFNMLENVALRLDQCKLHLMYKARILENLALEIIEFMDKTGLQNPDGTMKFKNPDFPVNTIPKPRAVEDLDLYDVYSPAMLRTSWEKMMIINNHPVVIELNPIRNTNSKTEYTLLKKEVENYIDILLITLNQLQNSFSEKYQHSYFEKSGEINVENWYRREVDALVFEQHVQTKVPQTSLNIVLLIDNSISINAEKQKVMTKIIVTIIEVAQNFPKIFPRVLAYSQNSSGSKKVSLTKLISQKTPITNPHRALHFNSSGVNYDFYALRSIINLHKTELSTGKTIFFVIGDSWPVSQYQDVMTETKNILASIRNEFQSFIVTYLATNKRYNPSELGLDYFVDISGPKVMDRFVKAFIEMISNVLSNQNNDKKTRQ